MLRNSISKWRAGFLLLAWFFVPALFAQPKPYRGAEYRTKAAYIYGRFEVRMKSAAGSGMLASFFTYHETGGSVSNWNEIDIETLGRYSNETQFTTITAGQVFHPHRQTLKFNPHQAFHVYAFEWTPDYVAWFVDGYEVYRQSEAHIGTLNRAQKIMMNIWQSTSTDWAGAFNPAILPVYGYYDWVKYYAYTPGVGDHFTLQWTDDFNSWDQLKWDKATHTFENNNAQFIRENAVFQDGYLILCLTTPQAIGYSGGAIVDQDTDPPYLVWAHAEEKQIVVFFSEEVEQAAAETVANYTISGVSVQSAALLADNKTVALQAASVDLSQSYVLVANNIKDRAQPPHVAGLQFTRVSSGLPFPVKINAGGAAEGDYQADQVWDFYKEYGAIGGTRNTRPAGTVISGTNEPVIYQTELEGLAFYRVRVPAGRYNLELMMADSKYQSAGERVFDVVAEGQTVFDNLDVVAEAGSSAALEKAILNLEVLDGVLDLYFKPETDSPILSGLHVTPAEGTAVSQPQVVPRSFGLEIYPNPFNPVAKIVYTLARAASVELALFDLNGRQIQFLDKRFAPAGPHALTFAPVSLSGGVYFIVVQIDGKFAASQKALYLK